MYNTSSSNQCDLFQCFTLEHNINTCLARYLHTVPTCGGGQHQHARYTALIYSSRTYRNLSTSTASASPFLVRYLCRSGHAGIMEGSVARSRTREGGPWALASGTHLCYAASVGILHRHALSSCAEANRPRQLSGTELGWGRICTSNIVVFA